MVYIGMRHPLCFALDIKSTDPCFLQQIDHLAKSKHVLLAQFERWRIYFIALDSIFLLSVVVDIVYLFGDG